MMPLTPTVMGRRGLYFHPWALFASIRGLYFIFIIFDGMVNHMSIMRVNDSKCFQMIIILHEVISLERFRANET